MRLQTARLFLSGLAAAFLIASSTLSALEQSPAPKGIVGTWYGVSRGNDPGRKGVLVLAEQNGQLSGNWTSQGASGETTRQLVGHYDKNTDTYVLKDSGIKVAQDKSGWRHCLIDKYEFHILDDGIRMIGSYWSKACQDVACLHFSRTTPPAQ